MSTALGWVLLLGGMPIVVMGRCATDVPVVIVCLLVGVPMMSMGIGFLLWP